ncbi:MAG: hypothetical protein KME60_28995 [Cyanomargarita calcarea GSE-NOS-MK-12-04C]|jgi:hypothetical protein|uniref:Uncharacterized protein n=1 Tax=Cyanomargarita calcarea GSE-NOS-MK-12-04C TaxID=2839659 RepID=A0A951QVF8_9CYAN|nr:hypothetical protein [Cyanomargarita calcarea GSE-NOS-MK-12-04C]
MQNQSSPLKVIINPPGVQSGMPGDNLEIHAIIINQGNQSAVIDVFFDEGFQILNQSNSSPRERLALAPQQSSEVSFEFEIPINAFPGTYDYTLVVDAPEHYPQETPIQYPRQIKVLLKEQTVIRENDPTFSVKPATNPSNQLIYKPTDSLQVIVTVDNRSNRVDRFRLTCPDLDDAWFTIRYPTTGLEEAGLLSQGSGLELNPGSQNQILLFFHLPADTLAGNYSPTIRLHSNNTPDLVLLELIYIKIPELYRLDVELNTILGKVSRAFGKYEVKLVNQGNTLRQLSLSAKTQEEEQLCRYEFEPSQVRLLPTKNRGINLTVKPIHWWRRPLFGAGLFINFNIQIEDQQQLPIPDKLPQGTLVWKARPWWQFLLLILCILGLLGGGAYIIWRILHPDPVKIEAFESVSPSYQEGDTVRLRWKIRNIKQLQKLVLIAEGEETKNRPYDFSKNIPEELKSKCQEDQQMLICNNFETEAKKPGKYNFKLETYDRKERKVDEKMFSVEIKLNSPPEVISFQSEKPEYEKGQQINLNWQIKYPQQLAKLQILRKQENGTSSIEGELNQFNQGLPVQLNKQCQKDNLVLTCSKISVLAAAPGTYTFALQPISKSPYQANLKPTEIKVNIKPKQFKIVSFTLNGSEQRNLVLKDGDRAIVKWQVEGDAEGIQVDLPPYYTNVGLSGTKEFLVNSGLKAIEITVTDNLTQKRENLGFTFTVEPPPPSINTAPTIPESNVPQVPNIPTAPNRNTPPPPGSPNNRGF